MANASEFFGNLGKSISKTADIVAKKTDEFISIQRIRAPYILKLLGNPAIPFIPVFTV